MNKSLMKILSLVSAGILLFSVPMSSVPARAVTVSNVAVQYYFPRAKEDAKAPLLSVINSSKSKLDIAIYSLTDKDIGKAIVNAKKRGVAVRLITDKSESSDKYQKAVLATIKAAKVPIKINKHSGLMHLKTTIVDNKIATTGSFNYTKGAETENDEVFIVLNNPTAAVGFENEFNAMWNNTASYTNY